MFFAPSSRHCIAIAQRTIRLRNPGGFLQFIVMQMSSTRYPTIEQGPKRQLETGAVIGRTSEVNVSLFQRFLNVASRSVLTHTTGIKSLALNNGVSDANASSARLLTQYIPEYDRDKPTTLPTHKPTIGEAIGVLAGGTLLLASQDGPFEHGWNFTDTTLDPPQYQSFPARYTYKDYASGGTQGWQAIFYVVLFTTFLLSATALGYLCWKFTTEGYVTDYTEPQNTFALAVNSPPSSALYGACGGGPKGEVMARKWTVDMTRTDSEQDGFQYQPLSSNGRHPHFSIRCADEELSPMIRYSPGTPQTSKRVKFRRSRPPTMNESWGLGSPVVEQYQRLAGRS